MTELEGRVNLARVYEVINEVKLDVAIIKARSEAFADHETRIRVLERRSWSLAGVASVAGAGLSQLITAITQR